MRSRPAAAPLGQRGIGGLPGLTGRRGGIPVVEAGPGDAQDPAQPLHAVALLVVVDELEAVDGITFFVRHCRRTL
jgi:hypothetical protein